MLTPPSVNSYSKKHFRWPRDVLKSCRLMCPETLGEAGGTCGSLMGREDEINADSCFQTASQLPRRGSSCFGFEAAVSHKSF